MRTTEVYFISYYLVLLLAFSDPVTPKIDTNGKSEESDNKKEKKEVEADSAGNDKTEESTNREEKDYNKSEKLQPEQKEKEDLKAEHVEDEKNKIADEEAGSKDEAGKNTFCTQTSMKTRVCTHSKWSICDLNLISFRSPSAYYLRLFLVLIRWSFWCPCQWYCVLITSPNFF